MSRVERASQLSKLLRRIRRENDWTLAAVAERTGIAVSTLSKIENNQTSPNFDVLIRLCEGIGLDLSELLRGGSFANFAHGSRAVNREGDGIRYEEARDQYCLLSGELAQKALQPMLLRVAKESHEPTVLRGRAGEAFVYVVNGPLKFYMEPYSAILLQTGESVHFDGRIPHGFAAGGDDDAMVLAVCDAGKPPREGN
ncbi:MAG: XRE family transcriptional regulator [Deltaproteobacteria bacterium]|nr:XRE family transcriptional regulator [Deltaproteobacteria bacterium]